MAQLVIGLDVGGTKVTGALATAEGEVKRLIRERTDPEEGAEGGFRKLCRIVEDLKETAASLGSQVGVVGVGFGGPVHFETGTVYLSHHVPGWEDFPLRERLGSETELAVVVDNDANAGTLGEWRFGAGRGVEDLLYINIGTGIGGGLISGGRLVRGWRNLAGEIGHMTVRPEGPLCTCGRTGCLEALSSGSAIGKTGSERLGRPVSSEEVFALALQGDPIARSVLEEATDALAFAIGAAANLFNPKRVILGGGVSEAPEELLVRPVRERLPLYVLPQSLEGLEVVRAQLGYDAGVMGAVALGLEEGKLL
ncbi:MAG: ROK family protein [Armatimonadetes bacterium]|nr:ROK family protein [Armatimonadota bacterium]MDW8121999.1 ROK family protein [Armatimonadota bacterium]